MLTDAELLALLQANESDRVERKRSAADRSAIRRTICALANDLPGHGTPGVIFVGVEDDGSCANLKIDDELLKVLAGMRTDGNILPIPSLVIQAKNLNGCNLVAIIVQPSQEPPVRYQGRVFVKVGATVQQASIDEERRLAERRRSADISFDQRASPSATFEDLDLDYFRTQYLPQAIAADVLDQNHRALEQQLTSLRLALNDAPTYGALLALGIDPQRWLPGAYVQFLRIDGKSITDPIRDQKTLTGRLDDVLRRLDELLELGISVRTSVTAAPKETRRPDYPLPALQQLTRNAVMHRSYESTNAPVRVYWYNDRIEIQSPGGLYGRVTPQNIWQGTTDYRNPLVAEVMHHLGYAQKFGLGLPLARQTLEQNGNPPPEFNFQPAAVVVTVKPAP
jgi:ATP-dependent DNA helicase RecG